MSKKISSPMPPDIRHKPPVPPAPPAIGRLTWLCRHATIHDLARILQIRNHPSNFVYFNNQNPISQQQHNPRFVNTYINNTDNHCFVLEVDGDVIAYCSFDLNTKNTYTISIAVDADYHGIGVGSRLLAESLSLLNTNIDIVAEIHKDNPRSVRLFESCGFNLFRTSANSYYFVL